MSSRIRRKNAKFDTKNEKPEIQLFIREKMLTIVVWNFEIWAVQKYVNLVDLGESFPTHIYLQNMASIQPRTSPCEIDSRLQDWQKIAKCWAIFRQKSFTQHRLAYTAGSTIQTGIPSSTCVDSPTWRRWLTMRTRWDRLDRSTLGRESSVKIKWKIKCSCKWKLNVFQSEN